MADDLDEVLEAAATQPQSVSVGDRSATGRSVSDLIALDKHLSAKKNAGKGLAANLRRTRAVPPSALGD